MELFGFPACFGVAVKSALEFLTEPPYSMHLIEEQDWKVSYASDGLAVAVNQDWRSYELDLFLWRPAVAAEARDPYGIPDLIRAADPGRPYRGYIAPTPEAVRKGMARFAADLLEYGAEALAGSPEFFQRMDSARAQARQRWAVQSHEQYVRSRAQQAWEKRDYEAVIQAYSEIRDRLSPAESKKLSYSAKQIRLAGKAD